MEALAQQWQRMGVEPPHNQSLEDALREVHCDATHQQNYTVILPFQKSESSLLLLHVLYVVPTNGCIKVRQCV